MHAPSPLHAGRPSAVTRGPRARTVLPTLGLAGVLAALATAAPAEAVTGRQVVTVANTGSAVLQSATAKCPPGRVVVGAAGSVHAGTPSAVVLDEVIPSTDLRSVRATGIEDQPGTTSAWTVRAQAVCAVAPPGHQLVVRTTAPSSAGKSITATCPSGKKVLGTGFELTGGLGNAVATNLLPDAQLQSVRLAAVEDEGGTPGSWTARVHAICATPEFGLHRAAVVTAPDSLSKSAVAQCGSGSLALGLGGAVSASSGQVSLGRLEIATGLTRVTGVEDENGFPAAWRATAVAICAPETGVLAPLSLLPIAPEDLAPAVEPGLGDVTGSRAPLSPAGGEATDDAVPEDPSAETGLLPEDGPPEPPVED